ncbi:MAG: DUF2314 domain-containing protein [Planctomycetes bacterium]|nr:DUF2314 domain-containing protein [Planctomycetota bacterium]
MGLLQGTQQARQTIGRLLKAVKDHAPAGRLFLVRFVVVEDGTRKYVWLEDVQYDGQRFTGRVNNEDGMLSGVRHGELRSVAPAEIADWVMIENGKVLDGGFTLAVDANAKNGAE